VRWWIAIAAVSLILMLVACLWLLVRGLPPTIDWDTAGIDARIEYYALLMNFLQMIVAGIAVASAAIAIPAYLSSRKEAFDRNKEARSYYTEASTGIRYMPERLSVLKAEEGLALINSVHIKKHIAEAFESELAAQLRRRRNVDYLEKAGCSLNRRWGRDMYDLLGRFTSSLRSRLGDWDDLDIAEKLTILTKCRADLDEERKAEDVGNGWVKKESDSRGLLT